MKNAKEKNKIIRFTISRERLMDSALEKASGGEYIEALSLLHKCARLYGADDEVLETYADIYEEIEVFSQAINIWFSYLNEFGGKSYATDEEVYEGLAVNYLNLGFEMESLIYYKKMIDCANLNPEKKEGKRVEDLHISEYLKQKQKPTLRLVYPEAKADYADDINESVRLLKGNDLDGAIERLQRVDKESDAYLSAGNLLAICYVLKGELQKGYELCKEVLSRFPEDVQTISTLAAVYTEMGEYDKSRQLAQELCERKTDSTESIYKIATVACENGLDAKAVEKFRILEGRMPYDKNVLYFLAVGEYKISDYVNSRKHFYKLLNLYPEAGVARENLSKMLSYEEELQNGNAVDKPEIPYVYRVSQKERDFRVEFLKGLKKKYVEELDDEDTNDRILEYFNWCFDEFDGQDLDLQHFALSVAGKIGFDDFIQTQFLRYEVADVVKLGCVYDLVMRNKPCAFGFVIGNIYIRFRLIKIPLGRKHRKLFLRVAADLISRYMPFIRKSPLSIAKATQRVYDHAVKRRNMEAIDEASLKCAVYLLSDLAKDKDNVSKTVTDFGADIFKVTELLPDFMETEEEKALDEAAFSESGLEDIFDFKDFDPEDEQK